MSMEELMEKKDTVNLIGLVVFLLLDIPAIAISIDIHSVGFTIAAAITGLVGLYALNVYRSMA